MSFNITADSQAIVVDISISLQLGNTGGATVKVADLEVSRVCVPALEAASCSASSATFPAFLLL